MMIKFILLCYIPSTHPKLSISIKPLYDALSQDGLNDPVVLSVST